MSKDRITVAWELRRELHAWIMANKASTMQELFESFPDYAIETLRKSVYRLRRDGDVMLNGSRGKIGRLFALTATIKPEWFTRQALLDGQLNSRLDKFQQAEEIRQKILDICNRDGRTSSKAVSEELNINLDHALRSLNKMAEEGEVMKHGSVKFVSYTPLKTQTMRSEDMRNRAEHRKKESIKADMTKQATKRRKVEPWLYVHNGMDRDEPIKGQGGQGNLRREFGIQASAGML